MVRLILYIISLAAFLFLASVFYMYFFMHMSVNQAVNTIVSSVTRTVSSATSKIEVPEHLSHTPSTAADNQLKRVSESLDK